MTEYEKLKNHATERGWTYEYASGDHIKFYPPPDLGKPGFVTVSVSVNSNNRSFKNSVGEFRKFDRDFMRTIKRNKTTGTSAVTVPDTESNSLNTATKNYKQTLMKPNDKTIYKQYSWLQIGTKVRVKNDENQSTPLVVKEIHSVDHKRVWDESDIVIVKGGKDNEHMAGDLDAWEVRKCRVCGTYQPINHFNLSAKSENKKTICCECQNKEQMATHQQTEETITIPKSHIVDKTDPFDICMDMIQNRLTPAERIMILSKMDFRELLSVVSMKGHRTDISLFQNDEIAKEAAKRQMLDKVIDAYPEKYEFTKNEQSKVIDCMLSFIWNSDWIKSDKLQSLRTKVILNFSKEDFEQLNKEYNKGHKDRISPVSMSLDALSDMQLYQELKHRGWEGRLTRSQTLE